MQNGLAITAIPVDIIFTAKNKAHHFSFSLFRRASRETKLEKNIERNELSI